MAITLELLEKAVISEVENLHIRIDTITTIVDNIIIRLETLERQMSLLVMAVEDLQVEVKWLKDNMVTKSEVKEIVEEVVERLIAEAFKKYLPNQGG